MLSFNITINLNFFNIFGLLNFTIISIHFFIRVFYFFTGISKHTRLRKEALNILLCLATKLKEKNISEELTKLTDMFSKALPDLSTDNQPEIKCRLNDIKQILY